MKDNDLQKEQGIESIGIEKINFLYKAIECTQQNIRFTDTKVGMIFLLLGIYVSMIGSGLPNFAKYFPNMGACIQALFIIFIILFIIFVGITIFATIMIVFPRSNPSEHIAIEDHNKPKGIFYIADLEVNWLDIFYNRKDMKIKRSFEQYQMDYNNINDLKNIESELIFELLKVSYIRELKIRRMQKTKWFIGTSLILSLALIILHFIGLSYYMPLK